MGSRGRRLVWSFELASHVKTGGGDGARPRSFRRDEPNSLAHGGLKPHRAGFHSHGRRMRYSFLYFQLDKACSGLVSSSCACRRADEGMVRGGVVYLIWSAEWPFLCPLLVIILWRELCPIFFVTGTGRFNICYCLTLSLTLCYFSHENCHFSLQR